MRTTRLISLSTVAAVLALAPAAHAAETIPGQYIVVMKDGSTATDTAQSTRQARREGGRVEQEFAPQVLNGFAAELDAEAVAEVRQDPDVAYVEPDQVVSVQAKQLNAPWGLDRIDQPLLPLNKVFDPGTRTGKGVTAYVLDTGIRATHSELAGRVLAGANVIDASGTDDCNGHGTHVAGLIGGRTYGVAKAVTLVPVKVLNCQGSGTIQSVLAGIQWAANNHLPGQPAVANLSLGTTKSAAINDATEALIADGVTVVAAAGNDNKDACTVSPASAPNAITVGATDSTDTKASYSNLGPCVDVFAPGSGITSAWIGSDTATNTISGTSMAAPPVAGVAALLLGDKPTATPAAVRAALVGGATKNVIKNAVLGSPNLLLFSGAHL